MREFKYIRHLIKRWQWIMGCAALIGLGFIGGFYARPFFMTSRMTSTYPIRENLGYQFIKPLLGCAISENIDFSQYADLKKSIESIIADFQNAHKASSASVYLRNLDSGRWMGIDENEQYALASLYKIVLMMAYLHQAEQDPSLLDKKIFFAKSQESSPLDYPPLQIGREYTVRELLEHLIIYSDNDAKDLLHDNIEQSAVNMVFTDLGLTPPQIADVGDSMSPKQYAFFFRTLYSATYLSRDMSEWALGILSKSTFKDGIVKGLPDQTLAVAHKYGYRVFPAETNGVTNELHDCGIVYRADHPYFLCVMTKGWDGYDLESLIQAISAKVYEGA